MRVVFMGTPEFAVPSLTLIEKSSKHNIISVVTSADKPQGRGRRITPSPVKSCALLSGLSFLQPKSLKDPHFYQKIQFLKPDVFVVVAFRILPEELFSIPEYGAINLHASLLPQYRGAAPIQWAIMNGERKTGLTTFQIDNGVDTGRIMLQEEIDIKPGETAGDLSLRMADSGARLLIKTLDKLEDGTLVSVDQSTGVSSKAPKITPDMLEIDWNFPASVIVDKILGLSPEPAAYFLYKEMRIKVFKAKEIFGSGSEGKFPGTIACADTDEGLIIRAKNNAVQILEVQREGKNRMSAEDLLRGLDINAGEVIQQNK